MLTKIVAVELAQCNIRVNFVSPGFVVTDLTTESSFAWGEGVA